MILNIRWTDKENYETSRLNLNAPGKTREFPTQNVNINFETKVDPEQSFMCQCSLLPPSPPVPKSLHWKRTPDFRKQSVKTHCCKLWAGTDGFSR